MRCKDEEGQAIVVVALAMGIFLLGAVGLAIDGAHLYAQRQMAQAAADAAAQAGIMSIFDSTNAVSGNPAAFSAGSTFTCGTTDARTPCAYAIDNGFGSSASDVVTVSFPSDSVAPGVKFSNSYATNLIQVTVQRNVGTTLMGLLGTSASTISATAMAGIVEVYAPVPILITHPSYPYTFTLGGDPTITICGGPSKSIQVNSSSPLAARRQAGSSGNATVDLSHAGPPDPGNCTSGTGASMGVTGGPTSPFYTFLFGSTGKYIQPASGMQDPLANVLPPTAPTVPAPTSTPLANGQNGCPPSPVKACQLFYPGLYPNGFVGKGITAVLSPGIYYIQNGGVTCTALCSMYMATGVPADATTGWAENVLFYNTGTSAAGYGPISIGANGNISLIGSPTNSAYLGMLFFQDRNSPALAHSMGGGGSMSLQGTIYLTNTIGGMNTNPTQYQSLSLQGTPGNATYIQGEIIVGELGLGGNGAITMNLNNNELEVQEVALVD